MHMDTSLNGKRVAIYCRTGANYENPQKTGHTSKLATSLEAAMAAHYSKTLSEQIKCGLREKKKLASQHIT